jgi:hypothetical protein
VKINAADMHNHPRIVEIMEAGRELLKKVEETKNDILASVYKEIG